MTCKKRAARGWRRPLPAGAIPRAIRRPCRGPVEAGGPRAGRSASWPHQLVVLVVVPVGGPSVRDHLQAPRPTGGPGVDGPSAHRGTTSGPRWAGCCRSLRAPRDPPGPRWAGQAPANPPHTVAITRRHRVVRSQGAVRASASRRGASEPPGAGGPSRPRQVVRPWWVVRALRGRSGLGGPSGHRWTVRGPADSARRGILRAPDGSPRAGDLPGVRRLSVAPGDLPGVRRLSARWGRVWAPGVGLGSHHAQVGG